MYNELLKKTKKKKRRSIGIVVLIAVLLALGLAGLHPGGGDRQGTSSGAVPAETDRTMGAGEAAIGTVSIEIDCSDLSRQMNLLERDSIADYIPADGRILKPTDYDFREGETVYDCLYQVCRDQGIQMESREDNVYKSRYVEGIGHLYEMDAGRRSGWTYYVDGVMPDYGCSKYRLEDGQEIRWVYTVDNSE